MNAKNSKWDGLQFNTGIDKNKLVLNKNINIEMFED